MKLLDTTKRKKGEGGGVQCAKKRLREGRNHLRRGGVMHAPAHTDRAVRNKRGVGKIDAHRGDGGWKKVEH